MKRAPLLAAASLVLACASASLLPRAVFAGGPQTNLSIAIQAPNNPVVAGTNVQYQAIVTNQGPAQAVNVVSTLTLPAGMVFTSVTPSTSCSQANSVVTCTQATLNANQSTTFTVAAAVAPNARGTLQISGETRSNIADPDQNNNSLIVPTVVQPEIDLQLNLESVTPSPAIAGAPLTYQFRVHNAGRSTATNTTLDLTFPANTIDQLLSASPHIQCSKATSGVSCALGTVAPAGVARENWITSGSVITVEVQPEASLTPGTVLNVGAAIDGEELEAVTGSNFAYRVDSVNRLSDLALQLEATSAQVASGDAATYTFVAENRGYSNDDGVVFSTRFPASVFEVKSTSGTNCTQASGTVTCALGTLTPGEKTTIVVSGRTRALKPAALEFVAELRGDSPEVQAGAAHTFTQSVQIQPRFAYIPVARR